MLLRLLLLLLLLRLLLLLLLRGEWVSPRHALLLQGRGCCLTNGMLWQMCGCCCATPSLLGCECRPGAIVCGSRGEQAEGGLARTITSFSG